MGLGVFRVGVYHRGMAGVQEQEVNSVAGHVSKYTRNNPFLSTVRVNELLPAVLDAGERLVIDGTGACAEIT